MAETGSLFARIAEVRRRAVALSGGEAPIDVGPLPALEGSDHRMESLRAIFGLSPLAEDVLVCLLALEYDPYLRLHVRTLQGERGRPWLEIGSLAELLEMPPAGVPELARLFVEASPLRRFALVLAEGDHDEESPAVFRRVRLCTRVAEYLVGHDALPEWLELRPPRHRAADSLVAAGVVQGLVQRMLSTRLRGEPVVVEIVGLPGTGRRFLAEGLATELERPLLVADLAKLGPLALGPGLAEVRRELALSGAVIGLANWDAHLPRPRREADPESAPAPEATRRLPHALARFVEENRDVLLLTAEEREPLVEQHAPSAIHVQVPFPTPSQRGHLLRRAVAAHGGRIEEPLDLTHLTRRYALDPSRLDAAARAAVEISRAGGAEATPITAQVLDEACRGQLSHNLRSVATRVTANHRWEDLVIPVEVYEGLQEMIHYIRHGQKVYEEWGFGPRHSLAQGVSALFAGPPGTGKTMCASVMARELDMELFRVDLSRVVSKWIGETEKNLSRVFDEAQRSSAIILFDEADALFAKRTEVKSSVDRYANLEVNFLLQRMEAFSGVTLLTTNFEDTIDTAFKRRLTFRLRFEKPDAQARAALWRKVFPASCQLAPDLDFDRLGALYEMSGANIRNAAVRAAFLAAAAEGGRGRPVDMEMCLTAAERESREMGVLTRSFVPPRRAEAPAPEPSTEDTVPEANADAPASDSGKRGRGMIPITRPRKPRP